MPERPLVWGGGGGVCMVCLPASSIIYSFGSYSESKTNTKLHTLHMCPLSDITLYLGAICCGQAHMQGGGGGGSGRFD